MAVKNVSERVRSLVKDMTLAEKLGQMTQAEKNSISPEDVNKFMLGSVLSGGGGTPTPNTPVLWREMVESYQEEALNTRLGIPLLYGVDAVHGHNNMRGATIFPHNNAVGMTGDSDLARRIGRATALECVATGVRWNFAPAVSIPQDLRWGRSYEGYGQTTETVSEFSKAFIEGLKGSDWNEATAVLPSVKHFIADGAATWGSSTRVDRDKLEYDRTLAVSDLGEEFVQLIEEGAWMIDQGVSEIDEQTLREIHLPPYQAAIDAGALNIMASFSSWGGIKMHAQNYLLNDVLKDEMDFQGFIVTDWEGVNQVDDDFYTAVVSCINAGIDMNMVPYDYEGFITTLASAVDKGDVSMERIDDAVTRILHVKEAMGIFEAPRTDPALLATVGCSEHRALGREVVRKSQVLLKNEQVLPLSKSEPLLVTGIAANDMGYQCGGWTISWMGMTGAITEGTTILEGIQATVSDATNVHYSADGNFATKAKVGLVVIAEEPYAEGMGDKADLGITQAHKDLIAKTKTQCDKVIVLLLSGRPLVITEEVADWDAFIAGWLPGTEGAGIADVLFGDYDFTGRLSYNWLDSMDQDSFLWEIGAGLSVKSDSV